MKLRLALGIVSAATVIVATLGACDSRPQATGSGATFRQPVPIPTAPSCRTPTTADMSALLADTDIIVEGTIQSNAKTLTKVLGTGTHEVTLGATPITGVKVLATEPGTTYPTPTAIYGVGFNWYHVLTPGRYIFFLLADGRPVMGLYGIFNISGSVATRRCPNYQSPGAFVSATGAPLSVAGFESRIPRTLQPHLPPTPKTAH